MSGQRQTRPDEAAIAELATRQHGVVGQRQLRRLGFGEDAIERRVAAGRLHRLHRGVFAVGHRIVPIEGRWLAAVLAVPGSGLSHRSAAALHHLLGTPGGAPEVVVARSLRQRAGVRIHCVRSLAEDELTTVGAISAHLSLARSWTWRARSRPGCSSARWDRPR